MNQKEKNMLLYAAIISNDLELVNELLKVGAFIDFDEDEGINTWVFANEPKFGGGNQGIIEVLLEQGTNIEAVDKFNQTVLLRSVENSEINMTRFLLKHGANIDCVKGGDTPLVIRATRNNNIEIVELLINYGADLNETDKSGWTALLESTYNKNKEIVKLLIENGAEVDKKDIRGYSPLYNARDNFEITKLLLQKGANPNVDITVESDSPIVKSWGKKASLLNDACREGNNELAFMLVDYGADPNGQTDKMKTTCLHWACVKGNFELVKRLVEKGANTKATDLIGRTPAMTALSKGFNEIFNYLLLK